MSEHDAHRALTHTARLRGLALGLEIERYVDIHGNTTTYLPVQRMTYGDIEHRKTEARLQHQVKWPLDLRGAYGPRERRKPSTVGERQRLASSDPDGHRQAIVDFISEGSKHV